MYTEQAISAGWSYEYKQKTHTVHFKKCHGGVSIEIIAAKAKYHPKVFYRRPITKQEIQWAIDRGDIETIDDIVVSVAQNGSSVFNKGSIAQIYIAQQAAIEVLEENE